MRRQRILRTSSAQSLCIFCACRLGLHVPRIPPSAPSTTRLLSTQPQPRQSAPAASPHSDEKVGLTTEPAGFDANSTHSLAEQREKARRSQLRREREIRELQAKRQAEQQAEQQTNQRTKQQHVSHVVEQNESRHGLQSQDGQSSRDKWRDRQSAESRSKQLSRELFSVPSAVLAGAGKTMATAMLDREVRSSTKHRISHQAGAQDNKASDGRTWRIHRQVKAERSEPTTHREPQRFSSNPETKGQRRQSATQLESQKLFSSPKIHTQQGTSTTKLESRRSSSPESKGTAMPDFTHSMKDQTPSADTAGGWGIGSTETQPLQYRDERTPMQKTSADDFDAGALSPTQEQYSNKDVAHDEPGWETLGQYEDEQYQGSQPDATQNRPLPKASKFEHQRAEWRKQGFNGATNQSDSPLYQRHPQEPMNAQNFETVGKGPRQPHQQGFSRSTEQPDSPIHQAHPGSRPDMQGFSTFEHDMHPEPQHRDAQNQGSRQQQHYNQRPLSNTNTSDSRSETIPIEPRDQVATLALRSHQDYRQRPLSSPAATTSSNNQSHVAPQHRTAQHERSHPEDVRDQPQPPPRSGAFGLDSFGLSKHTSQEYRNLPPHSNNEDGAPLQQHFSGDLGQGPSGVPGSPSTSQSLPGGDFGPNQTFFERSKRDEYSGTGYRAMPINRDEFRSNVSPSELDNSQNWQHLRRKTLNPTPSASKAQPQTQPRPIRRHLDENAVDQKFAAYQQARETWRPPLPPSLEGEQPKYSYDMSRNGKPAAQTICGRCHQRGHSARNCTTTMICYSCGKPGHRASDCPESNSKIERLRNRELPTPFKRLTLSNEPATETVPSPARSDEQNQPSRFSPFQAQELEQNPGRGQSRKIPAAQRDSSADAKSEAGRWSSEGDFQRGGRASRRDKWANEGLNDESDRYSERRKDRRGGRREFDDEEDEQEGNREAYRARKSARRAEKEEERQARTQTARRERDARKAEQATPIMLPEYISVQNLSQMLGVHYDHFVGHLEELGYDDVFPGKTLNSETSGMIAMEYNFDPIFETAAHEEDERDLKARPDVTDKELLPIRPSVVTIMGHVDHGKTTILDYLRKSSVAAGEAGGITQHIGAFSVPLTSSGKTITFLDTPGHAAFLAMRERGANVTDIVILVVAADDSVKPQTLEAIKHAKAAGVPMIVAINKVDKEEADVQRCKQDLSRHGVEIEDFGGDTQVVCVSGKTGKGMDELEESVVTLSEILDHRAETDGAVEGWVIEATTKKAGRVATVLVRRGTIRAGSIIVAGKTWARVKSLKNEAGQDLVEVGPGLPVEVDGWRDQPVAGDEVLQAPTEQKATSVVDYRLDVEQKQKIANDMEVINETRRLDQERREKEKAAARASRRSLEGDEPPHAEKSAAMDEQQSSSQTIVPFIIKADVSGSAEAVSSYILSISNPLIAPQILHAGVGAIRESDIDLAVAANAHLIAFNLPPDADMKGAAEAQGITVLENNIIYRVLEDVKGILEDRLPPIVTQRVLGEAEISLAFEIGIGGRKKMLIAGCKVRNGVVQRGSRVRVLRGGVKIYDGTISSLKQVKKDVQEMRKGTECGMGFENWEGFEAGDQLQTYEELSEKRRL